MLGLVLAALRARRAQAVTLFLLTLLAAASAAASPWYILASAESVAAKHVETAKVSERVVEVTGKGPVPQGQTVESALQAFSTSVDDTLDLPGFTGTDSASVPGYATNGPESDNNRRQTTSPMVYRPGICQHVSIQGACPAADDEVMISDRSARYLKLKAGDTLRYKAVDIGDKQIALKISGVYHATDPTDPYWFGAAGLLANAVPNGALPDITEPVDDAVLISGPGLAARKPKQLLVVADRLASGAVFVESTPDVVAGRVTAAKFEFDNQNQTLSSGIGDLSARVKRDQSLIYLGVPAGAGQLLLLCWLALYLSVKYTGEERRPDIGLLKLRGSARSRIWALVGGQSSRADGGRRRGRRPARLPRRPDARRVHIGGGCRRPCPDRRGGRRGDRCPRGLAGRAAGRAAGAGVLGQRPVPPGTQPRPGLAGPRRPRRRRARRGRRLPAALPRHRRRRRAGLARARSWPPSRSPCSPRARSPAAPASSCLQRCAAAGPGSRSPPSTWPAGPASTGCARCSS